MFSTFTHFLTLAAFYLHALLGCCGHHGHEHSTCVDATACDASTTHDDFHTHCHVDDEAEGLIDKLAAAWLGCDHPSQSPIRHSHSCNKGSCAYVTLRPADQLDLASVMARAPTNGLRIALDIAALPFVRTASKTRCDFTLVSHRCALQQSWQV